VNDPSTFAYTSDVADAADVTRLLVVAWKLWSPAIVGVFELAARDCPGVYASTAPTPRPGGRPEPPSAVVAVAGM
jgi:hypothetical protein